MSADQMKKYWEDPYIFSFDAEVKEVISQDGSIGVVLNETCFYPEGGGQPSDRGTIASMLVRDVQEVGDAIIHTVDDTPEARRDLAAGVSVHCHPTLMLFDDAMHRGQSEAGPFAHVLGRVKRIKNLWQVFRGDPAAGVANAQADKFAGLDQWLETGGGFVVNAGE